MQELARSWAECEGDKELHVRVWSKDRYKKEYAGMEWPKGWKFYESDAEWCGEALDEFWREHPGEPFYGFIADDVVLLTEFGLEHLEALAGDLYIAYPNDHLQRHRLCTHFCVGGELTRVLGYWVQPGLKQNYLDCPFMDIGINAGLLRYAPSVVFHHNHFLMGALRDPTYQKVYGMEGDKPVSSVDSASFEQYQDWRANGGLLADVNKVQRELRRRYG